MNSGIVFNIQEYSLHDGPGIRTVVFLKGCPLSCFWCSNPESQNLNPEIGIIKNLCKLCGECISVCPNDANYFDNNGCLKIDIERCICCGRCVKICPNRARRLFGSRMTVREIMDKIVGIEGFFIRSRGGVTFSGGEPTFQWNFLRSLILECKSRHIHTAVETCGYILNRDDVNFLATNVNLILYDIKTVNERKHLYYTGVSNKIILENLKIILNWGKKIVVRIPVLPGFNDNAEDIGAIGGLIKSLGSIAEVELLPYHEWGKSKYEMLGKPYLFQMSYNLSDKQLRDLQDLLLSLGLGCSIV